MNDRKPLVLVDGSSYLYRAFHAMPALNNSRGEPTGAVYGVLAMLRRLLADHDPEHIAVVFDARGKTFRDELYPEYKANRPPMPEDLSRQIETLHEAIRALGIPLVVVEGVEADDVIGTLAREAAGHGMDTLISTGDKDMAQLVDDHVRLVDTMKDETFDAGGIEKRFGVPPERIVDYLTLVGDTSDNIPGVPKVGPKTAVRLLSEYGSLDALIERADEVGGKVGENLRASVGRLPLSRELVTIRCDLDLPVSLGELLRGDPDCEALRNLYRRLEFKTWLGELGGGGESVDGENDPAAAPGTVEYDTILDADALSAWLRRLRRARVFAFDTETTSLNALDAELVGVSFADAPGQAAYVPVSHRYMGAPAQLDRDFVLGELKPLLEDPQLLKVGQNLKYDFSVLLNYGVRLRGLRYDTMLESYVLDSTASRHDMDTLAMKYLGHQTVKYEDVAGKGRAQIGFDEVEIGTAAHYAAEDADITLRLHRVLWPRLEGEARLRELFERIEMPLVPVLARVERNGVRIDADMLRRQSAELAGRAAEIEARAHEVAGGAFNIASPKQIQEVLFERLQIPVVRKTPKGQPSTAEDVLQELAAGHELPRLILEHRAVTKLRSTYTDKLPELINPRTGRVHSSFHQAVAATGRLSSSEPNLQNIPVRSAEGRRIREAFVADSGYRLLAADYSQIELRIMAHLSGDEGLLDAFAANADIHRATAAEVFGVDPDAVTDEQRRSAKAINFGLIYGMSAFGLANQLHIERSAAQDYVDRYFQRYPGVKRYMDDTRALAREQGYVETAFGRRLYVPDIKASNQARRQYAERTAINAPMQGTAADLIKLAMIEVDRWIAGGALDVRMILQVHDELVFEVAEADLATARERIPEMMSGVAELRVPLLVEAGIGENWARAHA